MTFEKEEHRQLILQLIGAANLPPFAAAYEQVADLLKAVESATIAATQAPPKDD